MWLGEQRWKTNPLVCLTLMGFFIEMRIILKSCRSVIETFIPFRENVFRVAKTISKVFRITTIFIQQNHFSSIVPILNSLKDTICFKKINLALHSQSPAISIIIFCLFVCLLPDPSFCLNIFLTVWQAEPSPRHTPQRSSAALESIS